ncbi:MAG: hypothetical protein RLZZ628_3759 [Bacteroidota bacterium]|jgi:hypothetical protein
MKKGATVIILFLFFACNSSKKEEPVKCDSSSKEAFDAFSKAVNTKEFNWLTQLTFDTVSIRIRYDTLLGNYQKPNLEIIPEEANQAYGIQNRKDTSIYACRILDSVVKKAAYEIRFEKKKDCFKVVKMTPILLNRVGNHFQTKTVSTLDTIFYQGEKGGCYYLNSTGKKVYIDKKRCGSLVLKKYVEVQQKVIVIEKKTNVVIKKKELTDTETRTYLLGKKGGCYYINSKGSKVYVDKSFCK